MSEAEKLLIMRQAGRISEVETWLALLIAHFGQQNVQCGPNQLILSTEQVWLARARLNVDRIPAVSIDLEADRHRYVLDAL